MTPHSTGPAWIFSPRALTPGITCHPILGNFPKTRPDSSMRGSSALGGEPGPGSMPWGPAFAFPSMADPLYIPADHASFRQPRPLPAPGRPRPAVEHGGNDPVHRGGPDLGA